MLVALWILVPTTLFLVFVSHVLLMGVRTRNLTFASREARPRPSLNRIAPLVNVVVAGREARSGPHAP
ncbi:hypothetical protein E1200_25625 [Actinomadura sp. GC306]|uniref:hypothetical protein n=1 Tax=Actinomadura sp. GC306 TaxID=2530367 RepID=UPI001042B885|nr:hypothetical protein [Actinomadura sp. GC306]TDC62486.1 hypothetical protein E1200_25625 [Actinomadura sp. GC306]